MGNAPVSSLGLSLDWCGEEWTRATPGSLSQDPKTRVEEETPGPRRLLTRPCCPDGTLVVVDDVGRAPKVEVLAQRAGASCDEELAGEVDIAIWAWRRLLQR
jgi:hypothetical protein